MSGANRSQRRIISKLPAHKIQKLESIGQELDDFIDELSELKSVNLDVDAILEKARNLQKTRRGIIKIYNDR